MKINQTQIDQIVNYLAKKISPYVIILFGSGVKGTMTQDSDIDIAFLTDKKLSDYETFMMAQELADMLGREVDLVNLKNASTVFRAQVVATGKVIYDKDPQRRMVFQMNAFKEYSKLNEERQCIFDKLQERGSMYDS
ncbi:MAG: nucleotidyltransferase domain-containing protein [Clostridia bacterium]|nr:nucleotidyltransferase domain-containing protein [Clostridia bacterium]